MKKIGLFLLFVCLTTNLISQNLETLKKRIETQGTRPDNARYNRLVDLTMSYFQDNYNWKDEIISIKQLFVEEPNGESYFEVKILTKNSGGPFYFMYDPHSPAAGGEVFAANETPLKFQQYIENSKKAQADAQKAKDDQFAKMKNDKETSVDKGLVDVRNMMDKLITESYKKIADSTFRVLITNGNYGKWKDSVLLTCNLSFEKFHEACYDHQMDLKLGNPDFFYSYETKVFNTNGCYLNWKKETDNLFYNIYVPFWKGKFKENVDAMTKGFDNEEKQNSQSVWQNNIKYQVDGRMATSIPMPEIKFKAGGIVVIDIKIDENGHVISAQPDYIATTTNDQKFLEASQKA